MKKPTLTLTTLAAHLLRHRSREARRASIRQGACLAVALALGAGCSKDTALSQTPMGASPPGPAATPPASSGVPIDWVRANVATAGPLCASGNSGGAAELGYGLGFYANVREALTLAVPTGGPVAARWDYACRGAENAAWQSECRASVPSGFCGGNYSCQLGPGRGCPSEAASAADLLNDSVLAPGAVRNYPRTFTHFLQGLDDCGQPNVPIGLQWHREVTSAKALEFLPNTPHAVFSSPEGQDAMFLAFVTRCR